MSRDANDLSPAVNFKSTLGNIQVNSSHLLEVSLEISCSGESAGVVKIKELILFISLRQPSLCLSTNT